jgi:hypothetical protein
MIRTAQCVVASEVGRVGQRIRPVVGVRVIVEDI